MGQRGRPRKDETEPRQHFGCRIKSSNFEWVRSLTQEDSPDRLHKPDGKPLSAGELTDLALEMTQRAAAHITEIKNKTDEEITRRVFEEGNPDIKTILGNHLLEYLLAEKPSDSKE